MHLGANLVKVVIIKFIINTLSQNIFEIQFCKMFNPRIRYKILINHNWVKLEFEKIINNG